MRCFTLAALLLSSVPALGAGPASRPLTPAQQIAALKAEIEQLKAENAELRRQLEAKGGEGGTKPTDAVKTAIRKHQIIKGMTEAQVKQAMIFDSDPDKAIWDASPDTTEEDDVKVQVWHIGYATPQQSFAETRTVRVTFKRGIVVAVRQTRNEDLDREPEGK